MNDPKTRRRLLALLLLVLLPLAWLLWPDGRVAAAKAARAALGDPKLTAEQRREKGKALGAALKALSPSQREALMADGRKKQAAEVARYFTLSPQEKTRFLDERINMMNAALGQRPGGNGPPPGVQGKSGTPASVADKDGRRQKRLDSSTPAERALMAQFSSELEARRRQRGLPARGPRG